MKTFEHIGTGSPKTPSQTNQLHTGLSSDANAALQRLLTRQELARRWGCCSHTIARRHDLNPVRLGPRLVRYRVREIEQIEAAACEKKAQP